MTRKCLYCGEVLVIPEFETGLAVKTGRDRYAHTDCIDRHGKENTVDERKQHILGAADSAHQGIDLAISLLQESLGNMGEILTQGCDRLGPASLGSAMRLGQSIKEIRFILDDLLQGAHGLCILLGSDLGVLDGESERVVVVQPVPCREDDFHERMFGNTDFETRESNLPPDEYFQPMDVLDSEDLAPGEDEFDDDEQPF